VLRKGFRGGARAAASGGRAGGRDGMMAAVGHAPSLVPWRNWLPIRTFRPTFAAAVGAANAGSISWFFNTVSSDTPSAGSPHRRSVCGRFSYRATDPVKPQIGQVFGFVIDPRKQTPSPQAASGNGIGLAPRTFTTLKSVVILHGGQILSLGRTDSRKGALAHARRDRRGQGGQQ
jgi:hypothetical protein